jgi:hypothetical protein
MGYSDQKYYARVPVALNSASWGTATAASATGHDLTITAYIPQFVQKTKVNKVQLVCTVIPDAGSTAVKASFMNGTSTMGTAVLTTATAGQVFITTISTNNTFTASSAMSIKLTGTATASGDANGSYILLAETQELFG